MENVHIFRETVIAFKENFLTDPSMKACTPIPNSSCNLHTDSTNSSQVVLTLTTRVHLCQGKPKCLWRYLPVALVVPAVSLTCQWCPCPSGVLLPTLWLTSFWVTGSRQMYSQGLVEYKCVLPVEPESVNQFLKSQLAKCSPADSVFLEE